MNSIKRASKKDYQIESPVEFKVIALRETPVENSIIDEPENIARYFRTHVASAQWYDETKECMVGITLNTRRIVTGFYLISLGLLDTVMIHPREVFRPAIVMAAAGVIVCHNHPSGDPEPSENDILGTRALVRASRILEIELVDHVIIGDSRRKIIHTSLKERGYFYK